MFKTKYIKIKLRFYVDLNDTDYIIIQFRKLRANKMKSSAKRELSYQKQMELLSDSNWLLKLYRVKLN